MKLTDYRITPIAWPMPFPLRWGRGARNNAGGLILQLYTDEGLTGLGCLNGPYPTFSAAFKQAIWPLLEGQNPLNVEQLWERMYAASGTEGLPSIIGGVDIALWDILGKAAGLPIYKLLGAARDSVEVYIAPCMKQPDVIEQECWEYKAAGYKAIKLRVGLGFVGYDEPGSIEKDLRIIYSGRKILGDKVAIGADSDKTYDHFTALRVSPALEEINAAWFEEPLDTRDREQYVREMKRLQGLVRVPLAGAQGFFSRYQYSDIVSRMAVDIIQPDLVRVGGITELRRVGDLADVWNIKCMPHVFCGAGHDIQFVATAHYNAYAPNGMFCCYPAYDTPLRTELLLEQPKVVDGVYELPRKPGLGIELNEDALKKLVDPAYA